jgi:hypothetical protein
VGGREGSGTLNTSPGLTTPTPTPPHKGEEKVRSAETMTDGEVRYIRDGDVATVMFDRPAARNAMT